MIYGFERERERERERFDSFFFFMKTKKKLVRVTKVTSLFRCYHNFFFFFLKKRRYHNIILVTMSKPTSKGIISYNCYLNLQSCLKRKETEKNP